MAMGWDDAIMLLLAAGQTAAALDRPENNLQTTAQPGSQQAPAGTNPLQPKPAAQPQQGTQPGVQPLKTDPLTSLASELAKTGSPPPQQAQPMPTTTGKEQMGPPAPSEDPVVQAAKNEAAWKNLLAASPQAIAAIAPLLMGDQSSNRVITAPIAGGGGGQTVMQSPAKRPSLGEILSSLRI